MKRATLVVSLLVMSVPSYAADKNGEFFVRGLGSHTCETYVAEKSRNSRTYYFFRSWLNGYITAYNNMTPDTFAVAPRMNIDSLAESLEATCKGHPDHQFGTAASAVLEALKPNRLREKPDVISATVGDRTVIVSRATMRAVQEALKERGYYGGAVDGLFGPKTRVAIAVFQSDEKLTLTGLPDQDTISRLLR